MEELMRVAEEFIHKIKRDYPNDVACVVIMGSVAFNQTHKRSDLDLFFIPKTDRGYNLGKTFIVDGIGFDLWPISWERLERIASYEERITSIILDGKVIYYSSKDDLDGYENLRKKAADTSNKSLFISQAEELFSEIYKEFYKLSSSDNLMEARKRSITLLNLISNIIALLNSTVIRRGRGRLKDEILGMENHPGSYEEVFNLTFRSEDTSVLKAKYLKLINEVEKMLLLDKEKMKRKNRDLCELEGFYEELINSYNKIYYNCEEGNPYTPLFAAVEIYVEWEDAFHDTGITLESLPDLISAYKIDNLEELSELAKKHQFMLEKLLDDNSIKVKRFKDFHECKIWIQNEL